MMRHLYVLLVPLVLLGCDKYRYEDGHNRLPKATQIGRGIFACYIGEETYIARRQDEISYNNETGYLFLENSNASFSFRLFVYTGVFEPGDYTFDSTGEEWISSDYEEYYALKPGGVNKITVSRLDEDKRIVSGTFEVDLISEAGIEKPIRDGRFDLRMTLIP